MRGLGLEPPYIEAISPLRSFFAASLPLFSLFGSLECRVKKGLARDELHESRTRKMSRMQQSETIQRRDTIHAKRRVTALSLPRLRSSVFTLVTTLRKFPFFLFGISRLFFPQEVAR